MLFAFPEEMGGVSQEANCSVFLQWGRIQLLVEKQSWGDSSPARPSGEARPSLVAPALHQHHTRRGTGKRDSGVHSPLTLLFRTERVSRHAPEGSEGSPPFPGVSL